MLFMVSVSLCTQAATFCDGIGVRNISVADGLTQNCVNGIALDPLGFLWIATDDGLDRFDGTRFTHARDICPITPTNLDNTTGPKVDDVQVDVMSNVWTRSASGIIRCLSTRRNALLQFLDKDGNALDLTKGKIVTLADSTVLIYGAKCGAALFRSMPDGNPQCLWTDRSHYSIYHHSAGSNYLCGKKLTLIGNNGTSRTIDIEGMTTNAVSMTIVGKIAIIADGSPRLRRVDIVTGNRLADITLPTEGVTQLAALPDSRFIAAHATTGLSLIDATTGKQQSLTSLGGESLSQGHITLIPDEHCGVWLYDGHGSLCRYDAQSHLFRRVRIMDDYAAAAVIDSSVCVICDAMEPGVHWISSLGGGLIRYDEKNGEVEPIVSKNAYVPEYIRCALQDNFGNIWLGGERVGVVKISLHRYVSHSLRPAKPTSLCVRNNVVAVLETSDGNVWSGTRTDGIHVYDGKLTQRLFHSEPFRPLNFAADRQGRVWVSTENDGVRAYDSRTFAMTVKLSHRDDDSHSIASNRLVKVLVDNDDRVWCVMEDGRIDLLANTSRSNISARHFQIEEGFPNLMASDATIDSEGLLWVATNAGLICFSPSRLIKDASDYVKYKFDTNEPGQYVTGAIRTFCEDRQNRMYVGMTGGGLCRLSFDVGHVRLTRYTESDGLPSDEVSSIACSDDSTLWVATECGLSLFNTTTEGFTNIRTSETDFGNMFNDHACCVRSNGNILWGTLDGIVDLDPQRRLPYLTSSTPAISDIVVDNRSLTFSGEDTNIINATAPFATSISIPSSSSIIAFRIADLGLSGGRLNDLTYMLEGYDSDWASLSEDREVEYHCLEPGTYRFMIYNRACGNSTTRAVKVVVERQWWSVILKSLGAVSLVGLVLIIPLVIVHFQRRHSVRAIAEQKAADFRDDILKTLNNELLSPIKKIKNSLSSINELRNGVSDEARPLINVVERNVAKVSDMVEAMLAQKDAVAQMPLNLETTHIATFLGDVVNSFDNQLAKKKKISTRLNVSGGWRVLIDHDKLSKMVQILLADAYKNTPVGGEVCISAYQNQNLQCVIEIEDNGSGIPYERRSSVFSTSMSTPQNDVEISMSAVADYAKSHHGEVRFKPKEEGGSQVTVILPTDYSAYTDANIVSGPIEGTGDDDILTRPTSLSIEEQARTPIALIVDDKAEVRNFMADRLRPYFTVMTADSVRNAQGKVAATTPDIVICDAFMEPRNGMELLNFMKRDFNLSHVPFFMITADSSSLSCDKNANFAPDKIVEKPIDYATLVSDATKATTRSINLRLEFDDLLGIIEDSPTAHDINFMSAFVASVTSNASRVNFGIEDVVNELQESQDVIFFNIKRLTGCTPGEYVKLWRLNRARKAIASGKETPSIAMQNSGVADVDYFNKCFIRIYGNLPTMSMHNLH